MKRVLSIVFCIIFFGSCVVFSIGMLIPGASNASENISTFPKLISDEGVNHSFGDELEEWFSENFAFRNDVVDKYADMKISVLSEGNSQVIVGKDGFLFFAETVDDYVGTSLMSDEEIVSVADVLLEMQKNAEASGAEFLFVCAPNKNTIYGNMMPDNYIKNSGETNLDRLYAKLDELSVNYTDLREMLKTTAAEELIYHKKDSHWNGAGALVAFEEISNRLGIKMPSLSDRGPVVTTDFAGDLDALIYSGKTKFDSDVTYDFEGLYVYTSAYSSPMDITITTRGGGSGKLLMFRDSFANALIPYAASTFAEVCFERAVPYNTELCEEFGADYVVVEIAERNIREIAGYGSIAEK